MSAAGNRSPIALAVAALARGDAPSTEITEEAFGQVMRGQATPGQIGALLLGLRVKGETPAVVAGAVRALRAAMVPVPMVDRQGLVDTCGTGGGEVTTFNISTASALVAVAAGAVVAKHGNRSYTSKCGSADVIEALGVSVTSDPAAAARLLASVGMVFLFAPAYHPAMRHVAAVRRELGVATVMNLIGPLANPAGVTRQVVGVGDPEHAPLVAEVLSALGSDHAIVVHGEIGMDEISPVGRTDAWEVRDGTIMHRVIDPRAYGFAYDDPNPLAGGDPAVNAARIEALLASPDRDPLGRAAVGLNAGAALYVAGLADDLGGGIAAALAALDDRRGRETLERLRREAPISTSE